MKNIVIEFDELDHVLLKCSSEVTVSNLLRSIETLNAKANEITFYNEAYTALERIFDSHELENDDLLKSIVRLAERVRKYRPTIEGPSFIAKLMLLLFNNSYDDDASESIEFINSLNAEEFFFLTDRSNSNCN